MDAGCCERLLLEGVVAADELALWLKLPSADGVDEFLDWCFRGASAWRRAKVVLSPAARVEAAGEACPLAS